MFCASRLPCKRGLPDSDLTTCFLRAADNFHPAEMKRIPGLQTSAAYLGVALNGEFEVKADIVPENFTSNTSKLDEWILSNTRLLCTRCGFRPCRHIFHMAMFQSETIMDVLVPSCDTCKAACQKFVDRSTTKESSDCHAVVSASHPALFDLLSHASLPVGKPKSGPCLPKGWIRARSHPLGCSQWFGHG